MYIKQVVIDGFKSYAQRTTVSGFDPQFNAITGLNGSGKSNILDSICFLLGISNLSQVRMCSFWLRNISYGYSVFFRKKLNRFGAIAHILYAVLGR